MYRCTICHFRTSSLRTYGSHYNSFHAALPNPTISCPVTDCGENLPTFPFLKSHISRQHKGEYSKQYVDSDSIQLQCEIRHCLAKYLGLKPFIAHLKGHIKDGIKIACPFQQCDKRFEVVSSFSSHLSRYHKDTSVHHLHVAILSIGDHDGHDRNLENQTNENNNTGNDEEPCTEICHSDEDENNFLSDREIESALTTKLATFLLSIQTKHHVPVNTIQVIVDEFSSLHNEQAKFQKHQLKAKLEKTTLSADCIQEIIHWYEHDNLKAVHDTLRSKYYRKKYYKEKFDYVEPLPHPEPKHKKDDTKALCYYVPLKDSLQALFRDEKISHYFEKSENNGDLGVLTDFTDGKVCNENVFFQENPDALKLLLYQDSFEIVNPLGSAKKKHKILAIYYTIGNLHPAVRTLIDVQQLLLLCREEDFKTHGQEKILTPIMTDLLDLEANGVDLGRFGNRKGSVAFVLGDNLGSHMIGGFVENFSSVSHNCRYCLISKDDLEGGNIFPWDFDLRTQENYNSSVQEVCTNGLVHHSGVKFDSVLNKLQHFHVTNPGLPPCLGHDLFEGIVKEDLHLILNYLVRAEWFDYDYLNKKIQTYKFKGSDANDKPPFTLSSKTVSGHAVQVWVLLRFLPLLIHGKIDDHNNEVWQLLLLLRQIVELICAPVISEYQVAIMLDLIEEYIVKRMKLFPNINLRAKHHFLTHYPELTLKCGTLIRLWTLQFESKHSYFKRSARSAQNYIHVTKSLAEKHQLLQALYSSGSLFRPPVSYKSALAFHADLYGEYIQKAVDKFPHLRNSSSTVVCQSMVVHGVHYHKGQVVFLSKDADNHLVCGEITMVLLSKDTDIYFVVQNKDTQRTESGLLKIFESENSKTTCVPFSQLPDYWLLELYRFGASVFAVLKHAVVDN